jgi:mono/diheme cytochrome c family protein
MTDDPRKPVETAARSREQHEPEELRTPIGWPMLLVFVVIIGWGAAYYFRDLMSAPGAPSDAGDRRSTVVIDPTATADGAAVFAGNCQACHQATGLGLPGVFPPLAGSEWVLAQKQIPIQILMHGLSGPMTVSGESYSGVMPSFAQLKDAEIAAVLTHIRKTWGNTAAEITASDVAAGRKAFADRSGAWTESDLKGQVGAP